LKTLITLTTIGILGLFSEIFNFKRILLPLVYIGLALAFGWVIIDWNNTSTLFSDMILFDNYALAFSGLLIVTAFLWFLISPAFFHETTSRIDHFALIIFALIGAVVMVSFSNLLMLFLGLEILSISMYILAGSRKSSLRSNEAALKYFLMGAFATGFLLFGIAMVYGATASFDIAYISSVITEPGEKTLLLRTGIIMIMVAMAFKVSAAPFHFWAPDVYEGSPTVITAFMSTVVKTAAFAAFLRLFMRAFGDMQSAWSSTLWVISALTILIGNITAVWQNNVKRMLAYSSIAHAGYMLLAILAMNNSSASSLLYYTIAYSVSSITSFAILLIVSRSTGNESIESFYGMARRNPLLATVTIVAMFSLAGIPPLAGFFAKYYIFTAAVQSDLTGLVLIAVLGSLIGVYYYFRVVIAMFRDAEAGRVEISGGQQAVLILTTAIAFLLGILPGMVEGLL